MFYLGKITISEKAVKEVPLKLIHKELEEYKEDGLSFIEQKLEGL
ncbi:hypothetical protein [Tissierella simiarum]|nr:hypothetical protein [Tissierella simiarum]